MSDNVKMLKKLTPKTVMGEKIKAPEKETKLFTIFGLVKGVRKGESTYGPWSMLTGTFEAVRDGVRYVSTECAIPQPLHDMIAAAVREEGASDAQFAVDVYVVPRPDTAIGYEYIAQSVVDLTSADPLQALRSTVAEKLKLSAPATEQPSEQHSEQATESKAKPKK